MLVLRTFSVGRNAQEVVPACPKRNSRTVRGTSTIIINRLISDLLGEYGRWEGFVGGLLNCRRVAYAKVEYRMAG